MILEKSNLQNFDNDQAGRLATKSIQNSLSVSYKINIDNNMNILNGVEQVEISDYLFLKWNDNKDDVEDEEELDDWLSEFDPDMQSLIGECKNVLIFEKNILIQEYVK